MPKAQENLTDKVASVDCKMIDQRIHTLNTQDIQQLEQQQKKCEQQIQRISGKLENLINQQINKLAKHDSRILPVGFQKKADLTI